MKFDDMKDVYPEGARADIADLWSWACSNPDQDVPAKDVETWNLWMETRMALQPRAADAWASIIEMAPPLDQEGLRSGAVEFPTWYGEWWVEVISYFIWDERLEEAIEAAEDWLADKRDGE